MLSKKEAAARISALLGITYVLESLPHPSNLIVLNFHRIGEAHATPYDSGTFSCTTAEFDQQLRHLKRRYPILNLDEALRVIHGEDVLSRPSVLLTFDDGYLDNYQQAYEVLRLHGLSATFFLPTAFIGTGLLPWWDTIAYIIKNSRKKSITLNFPETVSFDLTASHKADSIRKIMTQFKRPSTTDVDAFIRGIEIACEFGRPPTSAERCFLDWDEAREMERGGMCFGSHTHTHQILSKVSPAQQLDELKVSRSILERELGHRVETLAYPSGKRESSTEDTLNALREAEYRTAFSFYGEINHPGFIQPFDVVRCGVDGESPAMFRLRLALRATTGRDLF